VDATPAMLAKARLVLKEGNVKNYELIEGLMEELPLKSNSVDVAVTRYTFHHLLQPAIAFAEMIRVCKPGGKIAVFDSTPDPQKRDNFDEIEKMRDPSHTSAMTQAELLSLAGNHLDDVRVCSFPMPNKVICILVLLTTPYLVLVLTALINSAINSSFALPGY
jgi:ubiquinone/menaquinone biosynthesis C-methylase UbiE